MRRTTKKKDIARPILHKNYEGAVHKPDYIHKYNVTVKNSCKFCGAKPKDIVVYDMPVKNSDKADKTHHAIKVTRCTCCDNLLYFGEPKPVLDSAWEAAKA